MDSNIDAGTFSTIKNPAKDAFVRSLADMKKNIWCSRSRSRAACFNIEFQNAFLAKL